jgi:putative DNA primase/helicase
MSSIYTQPDMAARVENPALRAEYLKDLILTPPSMETTEATGKEPDTSNKSHWNELGFKMRPDGLYQETDKGIERICTRFWAEQRTRDFEGTNQGIKICWHDADNTLHRRIIGHKDMSSPAKLCAALADAGLHVRVGKDKAFIRALKAINPLGAQRVVSRIGWHAGKAFVLPDNTMGSCDEPVELAATVRAESPFAHAGTLEEWKNGPAAMARGNSRLMFALSIALSGPLLEPAKAENSVFHIHGSSSIGKTSAARLAATVWGAPRFVDGFMKSWRTTSNGIELTAKSRCDTCLILDEINMADPKDVASAAYHLSSGTGKMRMTSELTPAEMAKWRVPVLSTGEFSLPAYLGSVGRRITGGQSVRFPSLPADAGAGMGILEATHGAETPSHFIRELHTLCDSMYGTAGPEFVRRLTQYEDRGAAHVIQHRAQFADLLLPPSADGQVRRVNAMFGFVAAASVIASIEGIVPWTPEEGSAAIAACFNAWLSERGHTGSHEVVQGVRHLKDSILRREMTEIALWGTDPESPKLGFRRSNPPDMEGIYLFPWAVKDILRDFDTNAILAELKRQGHLMHDTGRITRQVRHPVTRRHMRFYCISHSFLNDDDESLEPANGLPDGT